MNLSTNGEIGDADYCSREANDGPLRIIVVVLAFYSIAAFALYSIIQKRKVLCQDCCYGFCGLPLPINFINETKDRWVYCAAFGMLTNTMIQVIVYSIQVDSSRAIGNVILNAFVVLFSMIIVSLGFFVLFASIHGPLQPLSHVIGFIYAVLYFVGYAIPCTACVSHAKNDPDGIKSFNTTTPTTIVQCIPLLLCSGSLCVFFIVRGIQALILRLQKRPLPLQYSVDHYVGHVKRLFRNRKDPPCNSIVRFLRHYLYNWDPYFKYSMRILSILTVISIGLLTLTFIAISLVLSSLYEIKTIIIDNAKWKDIYETVYKILLGLATLAPLICYAAVAVSLFVSLHKYRIHCKRMWRGDYSFIPAVRRCAASTLVNSSMMFGRQIAMAIWAWILYVFIAYIIILVLVFFIVAMRFSDDFRSYAWHYIVFTIFTFGIGLFVHFLQVVYVHFAHTGNTKSVFVDNRRLFHLYTYLLLYYNSIFGFLTTIRRLFIAFVVLLIYLPRLDQPMVSAGLEWLDKGYMSYISFVQVEAAHNNPALNVFVHLLMELLEERKTAQPRHSNSSTAATRYGSTPLIDTDKFIAQKNSPAARRWYLAYTLLRNPDLIDRRKHRLHEPRMVGDKEYNKAAEQDQAPLLQRMQQV